MSDVPKKVKDAMIAFRITASENSAVEESFTKTPMVGVKSTGMLARKLVLDYAAGRLHYANDRDRILAPEVASA